MKSQAIICAMSLLTLSACSSAPRVVTLKNGRVGYEIECRYVANCDSRSAQACGGGPFGVHERHEELIEVAKSGTQQYLGTMATEIVPHFKYVIECTSEPIETHVLVVGTELQRATREWFTSWMEARATHEAIQRRKHIHYVCSMRGPLRDEEIEIARAEFGNFECPLVLQ